MQPGTVQAPRSVEAEFTNTLSTSSGVGASPIVPVVTEREDATVLVTPGAAHVIAPSRQTGRTLVAWGPFCPGVTSNSTRWFSSRER